MKPGIIVLLNGTSSSGKTSISNELLTQIDIPFQHLSIDNFINVGYFIVIKISLTVHIRVLKQMVQRMDN
ncbi:phosphotransferase-like protein [Paenibacillus lautus]|uniref:phosphotransferase-like protein n=1 Tax=Paenibacillus lautus TaxID=1401 RepID=UPI003D287750